MWCIVTPGMLWTYGKGVPFMVTIQELYDLEHTLAKSYLAGFTYPWEALPQIGAFIRELGAGLSLEEYDRHRGPHGVPGQPLHHRRGHRGATLRLCPRQRSGGRKLRGGQFRGAEKRNSF